MGCSNLICCLIFAKRSGALVEMSETKLLMFDKSMLDALNGQKGHSFGLLCSF